MTDFAKILENQNEFFRTHKTKDINFRKDQLRKLKNLIQKNENLLYEAIYKDFGKSEFETYTTEISFIYNEIDFYLKNLNALSKPKKAKTNLVNQMGKSRIYNEPFGKTLIIGAWNYPYQLTIVPAISAIAAGNTVILKPSEIAHFSSLAMAKIINENFSPDFIRVICGGVPETTALLELKFDKIFFTGSSKVGKIVYQAAAKNLTPVTLELGGKSPAIITKTANIEVAVKRIVWGKFLNAGQTCIAPDYIVVDKDIKQKFIEKLKETISTAKYTENTEHYTKIINQQHLERLSQLINPEKVIFGGKINPENCFIEPTLLDNVNWDDLVMQEEIFGPILPILDYNDFQQAIEMINNHEKPLSAYLFTDNKEEKEIFSNYLSFGGGCINDTLMHIANTNLPFGGVGNSGIGNYHGKFGFENFSHQKAVLEKTTWGEPNWKYPPYTDSKKNILKKIL